MAKLGGVWQAGWERSRGFQGQIIPSSARREPTSDIWYPVLAKQKSQAGGRDIDGFEAVMMREERTLGYFVAFDFTSDARFEIDRFQRKLGITIKALTVREILEERLAPKPH